MEGFLISSVFILFLYCINDTAMGAPCLHMKKCKDRFSKLDKNGDGEIEKSEIENMKVIKERLEGFDLNNDENIDFSEYYISNQDKHKDKDNDPKDKDNDPKDKENDPKDKTLYQYRNGDGWINVSSVIRVLDLVMKDFDKNKDNKITYKEFFKKLFG